ncbi:GNAT family N-acetyltransferase [Planococcus alpniumensis]|uniref:GNAT family N-acetyltransferase n=1 Tax=Planococcus alpniumensis TaxID=2708345 RepID=UPI001B8B34EE|nr:GNAT family N-acetyltransferase [Planococcus sp. MSAK28401]
MKKVKLVAHKDEFCEEIFRLSSVPGVKDALGLPDGTLDDTIRFSRLVREEEKAGTRIARVILNEHAQLVGLTDLMFIDHAKKSCHIGTWIGQEYWGQGFNEASKVEILKIAFEELGLSRVFAGARTVNIRSQKAQEKLPFISLNVEGEFPEEHQALENKEKQPCILHVFRKEDFEVYLADIGNLDRI